MANIKSAKKRVLVTATKTERNKAIKDVYKRQGFLALDEKNLIKGVILNRISEMFCKTITPVIEKETGVIVLGCFPEQEQKWESRYLGLQLPAEIEDIKEQVQCAAQALEDVYKRQITMRVIHTSADFEYADTMTYSENAIETARILLQNGADIVTDRCV